MRRRVGQIRFLPLAILIITIFSTSTAFGDKYWNVVSGDWSVATNWIGGEPGIFDVAYVNNGGTATITALSEACEYLYLGNDVADSGTVQMQSGSLSTYDTEVGFNGTGVFNHTGGNNTITNYLTLGNNAGSTGTYDLSGTGQLSAVRQYIGDTGTGTLTQTGGTNTLSESLRVGYDVDSIGNYQLGGAGQLSANREYIGYSGTGTLSQSGGTNTITTSVKIGFEAGSNGTYVLSDGQLSASTEYVGDFGMGQFTQTGGINQVDGALLIANEPASEGTFELGGSGELSADSLVVGATGIGTFTQTGGTNTVTADMTVGRGTLGDGTYELSGTGQLSAANNYVGDSGTGTLIQTGGTNTITQYLILGNGSVSSGTYQLSGDGQLSSERQYIGYSGNGDFTQTGGTNTVSGSLRLGQDLGSVGTYQLDGTGALDANRVYVGYSGSGTFTHTGGTNTLSSSLRLGYNPGSDGTYQIGGTAHLEASRIYLGYSGSGTFVQTGDATVIVDDVRIGINSGSDGTYQMSSGTLDVSAGQIAVGIVGLVEPGSGGIGRFDFGGGSVSASELDIGPAGTLHIRLSDGLAPIAAGDVTLDAASTLSLEAASSLAQWGTQTPTIITASGLTGVTGMFGNIPTRYVTVPNEGDYLGYGMWFGGDGGLDVIYDGAPGTVTAVKVAVFQAKEGDTNGNRDVAFADFNDLANNYTGSTGSGKEWRQGDFDLDGDVDFDDFNDLANNYTGTENYYAKKGQDAPAGDAMLEGADPELIVDLGDGSAVISGGPVELNGYSVTSASGSLVPDEFPMLLPLQFYMSNSADEITAGVLGTQVVLDGSLDMPWGVDVGGLEGERDLVFSYGTSAGTFEGNVVYVVPEPATLALLAAGTLMLPLRRRRTA